MSNARRNPTDNEAILFVNEVDNLCPLCSLTLMYEKKVKRRSATKLHIYIP